MVIQMGQKKIYLKDAAELAVLYLPLMAISGFVEMLFPLGPGVREQLAACLPAVSGVLCFCVLVSGSAKTALIKWALSIPVTLAFGLLLYYTDFLFRMVNTIEPGYGRLPAGSGFALIIHFVLFTAAQAAANVLAVFISRPMGHRLQKPRFIVQGILLPAICIMIFSVVLYLELTMPTRETLYQWAYS